MNWSAMAIMEIPIPHVLQIVLAEDNPADVMLVRLALREAVLACELHVMADGEETISFIEELDAGPSALKVDLLFWTCICRSEMERPL